MKITRRKRSIMRRMGHVAGFRVTSIISGSAMKVLQGGTLSLSENAKITTSGRHFFEVGDRITIAGVRRYR